MKEHYLPSFEADIWHEQFSIEVLLYPEGTLEICEGVI